MIGPIANVLIKTGIHLAKGIAKSIEENNKRKTTLNQSTEMTQNSIAKEIIITNETNDNLYESTKSKKEQIPQKTNYKFVSSNKKHKGNDIPRNSNSLKGRI